jgi:hypothetical protein
VCWKFTDSCQLGGRHKWQITLKANRGKSPIIGRFPNMGKCIISHQEVLPSLLKNVNHQADETVLSNHGINGQLLRTSVLTGRPCFVCCEIFAYR